MKIPTPEQHTILSGKVYVYKRPNSSLWQCSGTGMIEHK
jgi:hypothetical protein